METPQATPTSNVGAAANIVTVGRPLLPDSFMGRGSQLSAIFAAFMLMASPSITWFVRLEVNLAKQEQTEAFQREQNERFRAETDAAVASLQNKTGRLETATAAMNAKLDLILMEVRSGRSRTGG